MGQRPAASALCSASRLLRDVCRALLRRGCLPRVPGDPAVRPCRAHPARNFAESGNMSHRGLAPLRLNGLRTQSDAGGARAFGPDVLTCSRCGGRLKHVATIHHPHVAARRKFRRRTRRRAHVLQHAACVRLENRAARLGPMEWPCATSNRGSRSRQTTERCSLQASIFASFSAAATCGQRTCTRGVLSMRTCHDGLLKRRSAPQRSPPSIMDRGVYRQLVAGCWCLHLPGFPIGVSRVSPPVSVSLVVPSNRYASAWQG
jgi:hypothetical protein